jgi:hypothetical protein
MCPIFVAVTGLIVEFMSHPRGRSLTLIGHAVQPVAVIALIVFESFSIIEARVKLSGADFLALLAALFPLYLLIWNYPGSRTHQPQPTSHPSLSN